MNQKYISSEIEDDEIDLIAIAKTIWEGRKTIIKSVIIFTVIGLFVALVSPKEYSANSIMIPQTEGQSNKLSGLSSIAAMAGVNIGSSGSDDYLKPKIYPQIINSVPFQLELMNQEIFFPDINQKSSIYNWYTNYKKDSFIDIVLRYTIGLPRLVISSFKKQNQSDGNKTLKNRFIDLTAEQEEVYTWLMERVVIEVDEREGLITISSFFSDPYVTAQVNQELQNLLRTYVANYKLEKVKGKLNFIEARFEEKRIEFEEIQNKLAEFLDKNKNVSSAQALTEEERLRSQYNLAFNIYSELAKQVELTQIQIKENTPAFTVIQPVKVPSKKSKPNRVKILFIWIFLGIFCGVGLIYTRKSFFSIKEKWKMKQY